MSGFRAWTSPSWPLFLLISDSWPKLICPFSPFEMWKGSNMPWGLLQPPVNSTISNMLRLIYGTVNGKVLHFHSAFLVLFTTESIIKQQSTFTHTFIKHFLGLYTYAVLFFCNTHTHTLSELGGVIPKHVYWWTERTWITPPTGLSRVTAASPHNDSSYGFPAGMLFVHSS